MSENRSQNPNVEDFVRRNATMIAMHVEENPSAVNQYRRRMYKCKDCDKEYDNFQALGGHRASHRSSLKSRTLESHSEVKIHECRICGHGFAIGQALGGHMRKHWLPKVDNEEKGLCHGNKSIWKTAHHDDQSCSSSSVTSNSNGKELFGYDLNMMPHENELKNGDRSHNVSFSEAS
ncbi:unnamed protein product [Lactuca virosa]|uniref:C2H2-type domain-containing protein n=1 Tax=Lactuca virosa TaxID=75947 RepID=A0AAU9PLC3_9ASTR|nr:unnamed protein product [Lactuca virosa]